MNLIDTYVSEVGKHLPKKSAADIEAEIRSVLQDMLEERSQAAGKPVDDELTFEVLKEYGAPDKVAASYQSQRYLIGPQLFPTFQMVLKIVLSVFGTLAILGLGIQLARYGVSVDGIFQGIAGIISAFITALGNVVLIFAIIEWVLRSKGSTFPSQELPAEKQWDPRSLLKISPPDRVKIGERIADIVFDSAAIVLFNFYPHIIGFNYLQEGVWKDFPVFSEAFFAFIPWLTLILVLDIGLNIAVLRQGNWKSFTRWFDIGLRGAMISIGAVMLSTPGLLAITADALITASPLDLPTAGLLEVVARQGGASILAIIIIVELIEIAKHLYRMLVKDTKAAPFDVNG